MSSTVNGHKLTRARVNIPAWGTWFADVGIDGDVELAGRVDLKVADLSLVGTVVSGGSDKGRSSYRIAGGAAGWGTTLKAKAYANDAGVKTAAVLRDAAAAAGETLDASTLPSGTVGVAYVRDEGPASMVLQLLAPENWYVGEDGVTRIGRRPSKALGTKVTIGPIDHAAGTVAVASDSIAELVPGVVVEGIEAVDVQHEETAGAGLRTTIWGKGAATTSRRLAAMRELVLRLLPDYRYRGTYEYRVVTQEGERLNLQPVRVSTGMPELRRVFVRPGVPGCRADVALGCRVLVTFVDADPSRPSVVGFEDADGGGFAPTRLDLVGDDESTTAAGAAGRVVRFGDSIMMPVGSAATPTPTVVVANPVGPSNLSRVRA